MAFCNTFNNQIVKKKSIQITKARKSSSSEYRREKKNKKNRHYSFTFALFITTFEFHMLYDEWKYAWQLYLQPRFIRFAHVRHGDIAIVYIKQMASSRMRYKDKLVDWTNHESRAKHFKFPIRLN